ncbi:hypothetical protein Dsin_016339 [Dipteronia sinensis]|uniref:RNase H type-1 domain-containing protein n=1 Tax=Dipteronia sinensis TaxID=43782 RepID=A0AAE0ADV4_9ROSI|nr:hypothetical protein Dsin_016339 [Dipteronia sinensis]
MKIDICKAFDTLDWSFLRKVLQAFGFSSVFVGWINSILSSSRLSVLINRVPEGQLVSWSKSSIFFGLSVYLARIGRLQSLVGMQIGQLPFSYLGVLLIKGECYLKHLRKPRRGIAISHIEDSLVWAHSWDGRVSCKAAYSQMVFAFKAELLTASMGINFAWKYRWRHIWLESDSSYVVQLLSSHSEHVPWRVL